MGVFMSEPDPRATWSQRRRYEFMEWKLFWDGRFVRDDIEQAFHISTPQASADIKNYREIEPGNFEYNATEKGFLPTSGLVPRFLKLSADRVLLQLRAYLSGVLDRRDIWFRDMPPISVAPDIVRSVDPQCLRDILKAIRLRQGMEVNYQSLTRSGRRLIAPHALAFDGHRWHARAWSAEKGAFRDYVLARISDIGPLVPVDYDPADDLEWERYVSLKICPHPGLNDEQKRAIEKDYGMTGGYTQISVRTSLAFYFINRMNLDLPTTEQLTPSRLQLALDNLAEVQTAIRDAQAETKTRIAARKELAG